jgi:DNA-binding transcriptional regulator YiaG
LTFTTFELYSEKGNGNTVLKELRLTRSRRIVLYWSDVGRRRRNMKTIRDMTADAEAWRQEVKKLIETDPTAKQIYIEMKAELAAARQLRELRKSAGLTQRVVAERMGRSQEYVSKIEHAGSDLEYSTIVRYALACGAKPRKLEFDPF